MAEPNVDRRKNFGCALSLATLAAVFVGFGAAMVACGNALGNLHPLADFSFFDTPPSSIPVPPSSCPSLQRVNVAATAAGQGWLEIIAHPNDPKAWKSFAGQLEPKLERFDLVLHAAVSDVPPPVAAKLQEVIREVEIGRMVLPQARTEAEYALLTNNAVFGGATSLSDASGLVGRQCNFVLAPDISAIVPSTTTVP